MIIHMQPDADAITLFSREGHVGVVCEILGDRFGEALGDGDSLGTVIDFENEAEGLLAHKAHVISIDHVSAMAPHQAGTGKALLYILHRVEEYEGFLLFSIDIVDVDVVVGRLDVEDVAHSGRECEASALGEEINICVGVLMLLRALDSKQLT